MLALKSGDVWASFRDLAFGIYPFTPWLDTGTKDTPLVLGWV